MLETQERTIFLEALKAPYGYEIDWVIGTSYSLDLLAFLTLPLSFTLQDWQNHEGKPQLDPMKLLESVRRHAGKISVFCQSGQIHIPRKYRSVLAYVEQSIIEVLPPDREGVFHPKVWVCRSSNEEGSVHYKVIIQTRNLTFDQSWDMMTVLDGELDAKRKNAYAVNHPLGDFIQCLPSLALREVPSYLHERVEQAQHELRRVQFELPEPFENLKFWPLGIDGYRRWPFADRMDRSLVISPFLSGPFLQQFAAKGKEHILITREESLSEIDVQHLTNFKTIYTLHEAGSPEPVDQVDNDEENDELPGEEFPESKHEGLHAKLYVADQGWHAKVWTGSANGTVSAFNRNVEFLVELYGKRSRCGVDAVLGNPDLKSSLVRLLREVSLEDWTTTEGDPDGKQAERRLEKARRLLSASAFSVHIKVEANEQNLYRLELHSPAIQGEVFNDITIDCWPLSLNEKFASISLQDMNQPHEYHFGPVEVAQITSFFAFELSIQGRKERVRFLLNFPLIGVPEDREEQVIRSIIRSRDDFLRYLLMLLSGDQASNVLEASLSDMRGSAVGNEAAATTLFPVMEMLIRALQRNPEQLDTLGSLVDSLKNSNEGLAILPEGFLEIWEPIWRIREAASS